MPSRENLISEFCWGALHHFLGLDERAARCYENIRKATGRDPLIEDLDTMLKLMLQFSKSSWDNEDERCTLLQNLLMAADRIVDPEQRQSSNPFPNLAMESSRAKDYDGAGRIIGKDDIDEGFSRHPYARFPTKETAVYVTLAAVCYLVRAYSHFFRFQKPARQYYVAKGCMNDLYQAYHLLWRTYENSDKLSHHTTGSLEKFVQGVNPFFVMNACTRDVNFVKVIFVIRVDLLCFVLVGLASDTLVKRNVNVEICRIIFFIII